MSSEGADHAGTWQLEQVRLVFPDGTVRVSPATTAPGHRLVYRADRRIIVDTATEPTPAEDTAGTEDTADVEVPGEHPDNTEPADPVGGPGRGPARGVECRGQRPRPNG